VVNGSKAYRNSSAARLVTNDRPAAWD
jgi:hypothetical protein